MPTIRFQILYVFLVLAHDTDGSCTSASRSTPQQREAFPWDTVPGDLLRDRVLGHEFVEQIQAMGLQQVLSAPWSAWQRAYVERVMDSMRREG